MVEIGHGNGKSPMFDRKPWKTSYESSIFHCQVSLQEGTPLLTSFVGMLIIRIIFTTMRHRCLPPGLVKIICHRWPSVVSWWIHPSDHQRCYRHEPQFSAINHPWPSRFSTAIRPNHWRLTHHHTRPGWGMPPGARLRHTRFLYQNGFKSVREVDSRGWSPMCYACLQARDPLKWCVGWMFFG